MPKKIEDLIQEAKKNNQKRVVQKVVPVKEKEKSTKKYIRLYVSDASEKNMHQIKSAVEYEGKGKIKYSFGDLFEEAMQLLAKEKGVILEDK